MNNLYTILISFIYIGAVILIATVLSKFSKSPKEMTRKFIHIMVGNWVFLYPFYTELWALLFVPIAFVIINTISLKYALIEAMERDEADGFGTVYYAITLVILSYMSFTLRQPLLLYLGTLIMTYGDGLAAIMGQKYGKGKSWSKNTHKSIAGSTTVFLVALIITISSLQYFTEITIFKSALIALLTGILAVFVEAEGEKGLDNLTLPISTSLFVYISTLNFDLSYGLVVGGLVLILLFAYLKSSITKGGIIAALILGLIIYQLSGWALLLNLVCFFILGSVVSKVKNEHKVHAESLQEHTGARTVSQVFANALPQASIVLMVHLLDLDPKLHLLAFAMFATAFSDTFASEIGMLSKGKVVSITTFKPMSPGVSGGVSVIGCIAGVVGSLISSLFAYGEFGIQGMILVMLLGTFGMIVDSYLGVLIQKKYMSTAGQVLDRNADHHTLISGFKTIDNNMVNFLSLCITMLIGILWII